MKIAVCITLIVESDWKTVEEGEEDLRNTDDAELWAIAEHIETEYIEVE